MASPDSAPTPPPAAPSIPRQIFNYLWRATWWKCPVCGTRPIFVPWFQVRSLHAWFTPLDGCPRCGYAYDREPGYFLLAQWGIGYGVSAVVGILVYAYLQVFHSDWSLGKTLLAVGLPLPIIGVLFARHAKAYFLAIDHLADPYIPAEDEDGNGDGGGGGGGGRPPVPTAPVDDPGVSRDPAGQPGSGIEREQEAGARREEEPAGVR